MGMFDYIRCEYPLPIPEMQDRSFQTKFADWCYLDDYTITKDGRLIHHTTRSEVVPEAERPYPNAPEGSLLGICGMLRRVPTGDVEIPYHGDIVFYDWRVPGQHTDLVDFVARFTNGRVEWIRVDGEEPPVLSEEG